MRSNTIGAMTQIVARVDDELVAALDELVTSGAISSRSDGVRLGLEQFIDGHRRRLVGEQIRDGYLRQPQTDAELAGADLAAIAMIEEEPW
jgi:Arc/MetJ-type ribon-helix-helix transcriptional regulator